MSDIELEINDSSRDKKPKSDHPTFLKIKSQKDNYSKLFDVLLGRCRDANWTLNSYYNRLQWYNSMIQTSVIIASSGSTFTQSFFKQGNEDTINVVTLCVSTYCGLTLSLSKFFRLDEKREKVNNLSEKFVELQNRINYQIDILEPWRNEDYYNNPDENYYYEYWVKVMINLEKEYMDILEIKKTLFNEYGKLIGK
jgi:hypothetical protein